MTLPIYIDIDGTLTDLPNQCGGDAIPERLDAVRKLIDQGHLVVIWSAGGDGYAKRFAKRHNLNVHAALGKPHYCVDDTPTVRLGGLHVVEPSFLDHVE